MHLHSRPPSASILIACFNEEACIAQCIQSVAQAVPEAEIVVVHGGTDKTLAIAQSMAENNPRVLPVHNANDRGKGHAIKTGIARSSGSIIAQFDADLQFYAEDIPALLAPLERGECEVTLGSRFLTASDRSAYKSVFFRDCGNRLLAGWVSLLAGQRVTDVTAGLKAWTREAIEQIAFRDDRYSYEAEIVVRALRLGLRIQEIPVRYASRRLGESMHRSTGAVIKAGSVILAKSLAARLRPAKAENPPVHTTGKAGVAQNKASNHGK